MKVKRLLSVGLLCACLAANAQMKYTYWFDSMTDQTTITGGNSMSVDIATEGLSPGLHLLNVFATDENTVQSSTHSQWFLKTSFENTDCKVITVIDSKIQTVTEAYVSASGLINVDLDMSDLGCGMHSLKLAVVDATGIPSSYYEAYFYRLPTEAEMNTFACHYIIDDQIHGTAIAGHTGTVRLDLDVASLTPGLHSIAMFMATPYGYSTNVSSSFFYKIPLGGEGVKNYAYWVNDDRSNGRSVTLDKAENPFGLTDMFDMPLLPFRSRDFALSVKGDEYELLSRNTLHFEVYDSDYKMHHMQEDYTDPRVSKTLAANDITALEHGLHTVQIKRPDENDIRWYSFEGKPGGVMNLNVDKGCLVDVFAPDGTRLSHKEGVEAMAGTNLALKEAGIYFVALHDFEERAGEVNLSYTLMNRNAIIAHTPLRSIGDGRLFVNMTGNGMLELRDVRFRNEIGQVKSDEVLVDDNYESTARFELKDIPTGEYDIEAEFENPETGEIETVTVVDGFTVEDRKEGEIKTSIIPSLRGGQEVYDVTLRIENTGNVPYWGVPVNYAMEDNGNGNSVIFKDFVVDAPELDTHASTYVAYTDKLLGTEKAGGFCPMVLPYLGPNETIDLHIGLHARPGEEVEMYFWSTEPWSKAFDRILKPGFDFSQIKAAVTSNIINAEAMLNICGTLLDNSDDLARYATAFADSVSRTMAGIRPGLRECTNKAYGIDMSDPSFSSLNVFYSVVKRSMPTPTNIAGHATGTGGGGDTMFLTLGPITSGGITPEPGHRTVFDPGAYDPNDMLGYTAPGGGNYVGLDVRNLGYEIEFENDPEFANASALSIKVTNTLDGKMFDLKSFTPQEVCIGSKRVEVPSTHHWIKTIDMRPDINSVAEVAFDYDPATGTAEWSILSLDPMSMEPTDYFEQGVLPVNDETRRGEGSVSYSVALKKGLADGAEISNKATIVFDANEPIETPAYVNITDYKRPEATIVSVDTDDAMAFDFEVEGTDSGSGIWYYDLYLKTDDGWEKVGAAYETDTFSHTLSAPAEQAQFMVVAIDRAGNVQSGVLVDIAAGDADGNGIVDVSDAVIIRNYYVGKTDVINLTGADATADGNIDVQDAIAVRLIYIGKEKLNKSKQSRDNRK